MWKELNYDQKAGHTFALPLPLGKGTLVLVVGHGGRTVTHVPAPLDAIEHAFRDAPPRMPNFEARIYAVADSTQGYVGYHGCGKGHLVNGIEKPEPTTYAEAAALMLDWMNSGYLGAIVEVRP